MKSLRSYEIVQYVQERKYCSLPELMEKFQVSSATIHRDVAALVKAGQVRKVHGGVAAVDAAASPVLSVHYRDRLVNNREVKQIIAEAAISEIRDGDIIFLDSSTTVYYLAKLLQVGGNMLLLDEPTNDLDIETLRALENALLEFPGCAMVISHDRWFLDRIATHILDYQDEGKVEFFEGNFTEYEEYKKRTLGADALEPKRIKYKRIAK